ncbi:uncharacterized protein LOC113341960 isoform X3 [Papaver somniferum]|uniref:uncharacterized protein LOC113341960 isoform X3 n=1 Tax=Papaver somniferum TaxID=3469 RepID=UPI000E6FAD0F|nr:uncharacterized protein LOC113341960 isoform X3 [Papaver somniferum]
MNMFTCGGKKLKLTIWGVGQDMVNVSNDDCNQYNISLGVKHPSNLQNEFEELKIQYRDLRLIHLAWEGSLSPPRFLHIHKVTLKERNLDLTDKVNHVESKLQFIALCYSIWIVKVYIFFTFCIRCGFSVNIVHVQYLLFILFLLPTLVVFVVDNPFA